MLLGWLGLAGFGCSDDSVTVTDTLGGTSTGTTASTDTSSGDVPTTTQPPTTTEGGMTLGTEGTSTTASTTDDLTVGTTATTDTSTTGDSTSTGDTDGTTGAEVVGRTVSQTVNAGHLVQSPNFRLVFTMGQPTQNQGTTSSPNFKLRGGLVGANGSPP
ncbi:hypothetical protein [Nannocystis pusilla]|uniref:Lipoprotein n=1 Tax=Nannocystis pusilla TaxID=889268 RepID=A0ABS7U0F3_9BACT|nr:hypothetical protein [Nannocystis pusilla]MBZ5713761.1 hypothetical protein [Nannocystis pusilla]